MNSELAQNALGNAIAKAGGLTYGIIFHSGRGCQYEQSSLSL